MNHALLLQVVHDICQLEGILEDLVRKEARLRSIKGRGEGWGGKGNEKGGGRMRERGKVREKAKRERGGKRERRETKTERGGE